MARKLTDEEKKEAQKNDDLLRDLVYDTIAQLGITFPRALGTLKCLQIEIEEEYRDYVNEDNDEEESDEQV